MGKHKYSKREQLHRLQAMVSAVADKFYYAPQDHRRAAVLGMFVGECQGGAFSAEDLHDAWEEMAGVGRVVRDDFCLRPVADSFEIMPMVGIDGVNESEVH